MVVSVEYGPLSVPGLVTHIYWISLFLLLIKALIARDFARTPQAIHLWLLFLYPFYMIFLRGPTMYAEMCELLRIGAKHPYVPDHIWEEIPWW